MKKFVAKCLSLALSAACAFGCIVGCAKKDDPNTLEIFAEEFGYGVQWLRDIKDAFEQEQWVKDEFPNLTVTIKTTVNQGQAGNTIIAGPRSNDYDLLFTTVSQAGWYSRNDENADMFEDLSEVFNATVPCESKKVGEKMIDTYVGWSGMDYDNNGTVDKYNVFPWVNGYVGILYNPANLDAYFGNDWREPLTTQELEELADRVVQYAKDNELTDVYPIVGPNVGYWESVVRTWWAQYQTREGFTNYLNGGVDEDRQYHIEAIQQTGKLRAYEALEGVLGAPGDKTATGDAKVTSKNDWRNSQWDFGRLQMRFLDGNGVFMANGNWFDNEMRASAESGNITDSKIKYMKMPVISSLVEQLNIWSEPAKVGLTMSLGNDNKLTEAANKSAGYPSLNAAKKAEYDEILRGLVEIVDGTASQTKIDGVKAKYTEKGKTDAQYNADVARVRAARHLMAPVEGHEAFIPSYATAKDPAKAFLKFMATDKAIGLFVKATQGCLMPFEYSNDKIDALGIEMTDLQKSCRDMVNAGGVQLPVRAAHRMYLLGGFSTQKYSGGTVETLFTAQNGVDRMSALDLWQWDVTYYYDNNKAMWTNALRTAGIQQ